MPFAAQIYSPFFCASSMQFMINKHATPYLFRGLRFNKYCINIFGFGQQLRLRINGLVFFTGQPKLDVFLTEFGPEELREGFQSVWCRETETQKLLVTRVEVKESRQLRKQVTFQSMLGKWGRDLTILGCQKEVWTPWHPHTSVCTV